MRSHYSVIGELWCSWFFWFVFFVKVSTLQMVILTGFLSIICLPLEIITLICVSIVKIHNTQLQIKTKIVCVCVWVFLCVSVFLCVCLVTLTHNVEPPLPMRLCHNDAHHVSDGLCFHDSKGEVGLLKSDWFCRRWWVGDPLYVKSSRGRAGRAALVCGFNLGQREKWTWKYTSCKAKQEVAILPTSAHPDNSNKISEAPNISGSGSNIFFRFTKNVICSSSRPTLTAWPSSCQCVLHLRH